jgi:protein SCO1/2
MTAGKANRFSSILIVLLGLRRTLARRMGGWAAAAALGMWAPGAFAADAPDPHAECHHHAAPGAARTSTAYAVPDVELVRDDGKTVRLSQELDDGRPVVLSFIFTSCTTVCPMLSATLAQLQRKLGPARDQVHVVSISIDPEFDTPGRLREYARKLGAGPEWQHYGGTLTASKAVQRAFGVYRGEKMNHAPATLVRTRPGAEWVRFDGFATADQLLAELPGVRASL